MIVFRKSIRYELSKYIVISMFFFLAAVLIFSFQYLGRFFSKSAESHAMTILHETDSKIDSFFDEIERLSESLVNYSAVYEVRTDEMKELFIANVEARKKYLRAVYLGTKEGMMYEWGVGDGFKDHTPTFPEGYTPVIRPWYMKGFEEGKHSVTDPYKYASIKKLGITSVNPVYDEEGGFVGILGIDVMLESMRDFIDDIDVEKDGRIILMTRDGEVIASQLDEIDKAQPLNEILIKTLSGNLTERSGSFIGSSSGENYYFAYVRNSLTGWNLSIVYPYDSITKDIKNVITMISSVYFILIILLFITLVSLSRIIIIGPLEELFSVMKKMESGEKNVRVNIRTSNELGVIGDQFNKLFDVIRDYSESLEKKVEERTSEVIKLQKENTRLRIIEEKERILQDLHDSIGAKLTNINICNNVLYAIDSENNQVQKDEMLQRISENCSNAIRELREITIKDRDHYNETLTDYIENRMRKRLELKNIDLKVKWKVKNFALSVEPEAEKELVNIFKELVSNVLKHSEAGKVFLILGKEKNRLIITFSDDGVGIAEKESLASGSGVRNIRKRMRSIKGSAEIETGKNKGFKVILKFPPVSMS